MIDGSDDETEPEWVQIEFHSVPNRVRQAVIASITTLAVIGLALAAILSR
jgi:hypothetical protein